MKYLRNGLYLGILLMTLLSACGGATPTATPTPTGLVKNPNFPPPGVVGTVGPIGLAPACTPADVTFTNTSFCANQGAGLGGATLVYQPASSNGGFFITKPGSVQCSYPNNEVICSGPQNAKAQYFMCTSCGWPNTNSKFGDYQCAKGLIKDSNGNCVLDPNGDWIGCTYTSHFDIGLQACVDNVSGKPIPVTDVCPPGYPYYLAGDGYCLAKPYPVVYNCQYATVQLGACLTKVNKIPGAGSQCPSGQTYKCKPGIMAPVCSCQ